MTKKSKPPTKRVPTPRQQSRWQRERHRQRLTSLSGLAVIIAILAVMGFGYYWTRLAPAGEAAVRVNDRVFNLRYYTKYLRASLREQKTREAVLSRASTLAEQLQNMELVHREAGRRSISVSAAELEEAIDKNLTSGQEEELGKAARLQRYQSLLGQLGLADAEYRYLVESNLLLEKLRQELEAGVPQEAEQVHLWGILLSSKEQASAVRARLEAREDFATLAKELSEDAVSKEQGGDLGWLPRGLRPELEEVAFSLELGAISQPLATAQGHYILQVTERAPSRPLDEKARDTLKQRALDEWLEKEKQRNRLEEYLFDKATGLMEQRKLSWIMAHLQ